MSHIGTITTAQQLKMERQVRRQSDIDNGFKPLSNSIHKSKKSYNRKVFKQINWD